VTVLELFECLIPKLAQISQLNRDFCGFGISKDSKQSEEVVL